MRVQTLRQDLKYQKLCSVYSVRIYKVTIKFLVTALENVVKHCKADIKTFTLSVFYNKHYASNSKQESDWTQKGVSPRYIEYRNIKIGNLEEYSSHVIGY